MKVAVVTRKLASHPISVVTAVIGIHGRDDVNDVDHYLSSKAKAVIDDFKDKFPEFKDKTTIWDVTIHEITT